MSESGRGDARERRFGDFVFDGERQQLVRDGREVPMSPKAFRVLELLVHHAGEVITKDRLLDEVWGDVHVLEGVVKVCVAEIRKALGETGARPRHLYTVQRRGYRFELGQGDVAATGDTGSNGANRARGLRCHGCGTDVAVGDGFCAGCGARLDAGSERTRPLDSPMPEAARPAPSTEPQVRPLTVLCCEGLAPSVGGEAGLGGELRESCRTTCVAIVRSLGGRIVSDGDDRLVAWFGHPRSREDDAVRAVRASLRMLERVPAINARIGDDDSVAPIELRIGVATGPVVVAGDGSRGAPRLGETGELVASLASSAPAGATVVCDTTRPLLRDAFELEALASEGAGPGLATLHRVLRPRREAEGPVDLTESHGRSEMIGREQEAALLLDRWAKVREGQGQAVLVSGEAGIGKSRLVEVLRERIGAEPHGWVELRGSAYHQNSAFHPVIDLLRRAFQFVPEDAPEEQVARLEIGLEQAGLPVDDMLPFFTDLLSLPLLLDSPPSQLSPELQRTRTLEAMCAWLFGLADQRPLVVVAEDLHWTDPSTIELLGMLMEHGQWYPMLVVATHRPEFAPPWASVSPLVLPLHPLGRKEVEVLVANVAGGKRVPRSVREHVLAKGDGIPLFVEELTRSVLDSDLLEESDDSWERTDPLPGWSVPSTLQDSLEARLDRLGSAKQLLEVAAVLGREFSHADLEAIVDAGEDALATDLRELIDTGLLYRRGVPPRVRYAFKHALIQDIAYRSLLPETRTRHHARIAQSLEERFPDRLDVEPESIARHYEEGGMAARAIDAYERAGERAAQRSADSEAVAHFKKALAILGKMPAGDERDHREIALQVAIGTPLAALRGFGSAEVREAYGRARDLMDRVGESPRLGEVLDGLVSFYITQSQLEDATALVDQQMRLAEREHDAERFLSAHYCLGIIHYFQGDPRKALDHFAEVDALYDPVAHRDLLSIRGENVGVAAAIWSAWALWIRGYSDRAVEACLDAIDRANDAGHLFSLAYAHAWASVVHWNRRDRPEATEHAERAIEIAEEYGFPIPLGVARLVRLRSRSDGKMTEADLKHFEAALAELAGTGTQAAVPQILAGIGEYCLERQRPEWASGYVDGALAVSAATGQPHWDAECYRAKAALLRAQKPDALDEVEALYESAREVAVRQHARSLELRAALDLARLVRGRGRDDDARAILEPIVAWFGDGGTAPDLVDARELLAALEG